MKTLKECSDWIGREDVVDLGEWNYGRGDKVYRYHLYALPNSRDGISFGAHYGPNPEDYESGEVSTLDGGQAYLGHATGVAAGRYLAKVLRKEIAI